MIAFVWAQDKNGLIGKNGRLPWHLKDDLQFFRQVTTGQLMVMGRTTYEGMPNKPLPDRVNLVLSRNPDYKPKGATVIPDRQALLAYAKAHSEQNLMIVGGAKVFAAFADDVDTLYVTRLEGTFTGDTYMPKIDFAAFTQTNARQVVMPDPKLTHTFETWVRQQ